MALITYVSRVQFEAGAIALLPDELPLLSVKNPLLVSDPGVAAAGLVDRAQEALPKAAPIYGDTPSNPTEAAVLDALAIYRARDCDGVVAVGGGSSIDLAKAVALLATHPGQLADYTMAGGGSDRIGQVAPVIAVPTTAGTGAEVGRAASLTLLDGGKAACVNPRLIPRVAICDPDLTLSLPPRQTAATGMDALSHGIEAFCSPRINPPADAIALDCVARAATWLPRAVADGDDREARWQMAMAAVEGGMVFQKGLGAVHAASHPLGALGHHHGELNAILLPPVLRHNRALAPEKLSRLKEVIGVGDADDLAEWTETLVQTLGLPTRLAELGITESDVDAAAEQAVGEHLNQTNPRPLNAVEYRDILHKALI
ncbi:MAG: iron-containing alcohol dehydrogenase [Pseudomonadota bacterium]